MTMHHIYAKLRKQNIKHYYMLIFCAILSIILVTSYGVMFLSPTVQDILPAGGDSNKQAYFVFAITIIGCVFFTTYASSLFFKYKSREAGIFLSLGARKSQIKRVLFTELLLITSTSSIIGLALSIPVSYGIWKLFQLFIIDSQDMSYQIGWNGMILGVIFCLFVTLSIFIKGGNFIRRTHIMDILNEHHKSEMVREVKPWYGIVGILFVLIGLILGYGVPQWVIKHYHYIMPPIWNLIFLLTVIGLYMVITYTIIYSKKGKNPRKYYGNIIPKSMMKFMGKQTVRTMCVISLLISGALFASFYTPSTMAGIFYSIDHNPFDYSFHYKMTEDQISKDEINALAKEYDIKITAYNEVPSISLIVNGSYVHFTDTGIITFDYVDQTGYSEFFSESDFNRVSGQDIHVKPGEYLTIITPESAETIYEKFNDLNKITDPISYIPKTFTFAGTVIFQPFVKENTTKYVISDEDYRHYAENLSIENYEKFVLFNVEEPSTTYPFANALKNELITRSSENAAVSKSYDAYSKKLALEKGQDYLEDEPVDLSSHNNRLFSDWKYYPSFGVLYRQDLMKNMAVFFMLFVYIALVCFTAVGIIAYTRSVTIAINNKVFFLNLKKLGATNIYIEKCIKTQLKKIFFIPTLIGSIIIYLFFTLIMFGNSSDITISEYIGLGIDLGVMLIAILFMYLVYKLSYRKFKKIIGI